MGGLLGWFENRCKSDSVQSERIKAMPKKVKVKSYGRTATKSPFSIDPKNKKSDGNLEFIIEAAKKLKVDEYDGFNHEKIEEIFKKIKKSYAYGNWYDIYPKNKEKKAALKNLAESAKKLVNAASKYRKALDELDTTGQRIFGIDILESAEAQANEIYSRALIPMIEIKKQLSIKNRPEIRAQYELAKTLVAIIEEKYPGRLFKTRPEFDNGEQVQKARRDAACFSFIFSIMKKAFPPKKTDTLRKAITEVINETLIIKT
jgi:hypothetical protein